MRWSHRSIPFAAFALGAALIPGVLVAQEGTPSPDERLPSPESCRIEPRPADEVASLLGLNGGAPGTPPTGSAERAGSIPVPLGRSASQEVTQALNATAHELLACINAGDVLRQTALFTDAAVGPVFGPIPTDPAGIERALADLQAPPTPRAEQDRQRFISLSDASTLDDGRAAAFLVFNEPVTRPGGPEAFLLFFVQEGDRWLIDGLFDFSVTPDPTAGTPEATPGA